MTTAPEYVAARRVLLDALEALRDHINNLILVGAKAVYLHVKASTVVVPPMTTDGDLALNTQDLAGSPEIAQTLITAGFAPGSNPGHWVGAQDVAIDIMIALHQAGTTSKAGRSARIPPHAKNVGRIAPGLEPALIDNTVHRITAFEVDDRRAHQLRVANPAALIVAKTIKVAERKDHARRQPERLQAKDALDIFRLLQDIDTEDLTAGFKAHRTEPEAARVSTHAVEFFAADGTRHDGLMPRLATDAAFGDPTVAPAFAALARQLIAALS